MVVLLAFVGSEWNHSILIVQLEWQWMHGVVLDVEHQGLRPHECVVRPWRENNGSRHMFWWIITNCHSWLWQNAKVLGSWGRWAFTRSCTERGIGLSYGSLGMKGGCCVLFYRHAISCLRACVLRSLKRDLLQLLCVLHMLEIKNDMKQYIGSMMLPVRQCVDVATPEFMFIFLALLETKQPHAIFRSCPPMAPSNHRAIDSSALECGPPRNVEFAVLMLSLATHGVPPFEVICKA